MRDERFEDWWESEFGDDGDFNHDQHKLTWDAAFEVSQSASAARIAELEAENGHLKTPALDSAAYNEYLRVANERVAELELEVTKLKTNYDECDVQRLIVKADLQVLNSKNAELEIDARIMAGEIDHSGASMVDNGNGLEWSDDPCQRNVCLIAAKYK